MAPNSKNTTAKPVPPAKKTPATKPKTYNRSKREILQKKYNELIAQRDDLQQRLADETNMANFHANCTDHQTVTLDGSPQDLVEEMRTQLADLKTEINAITQEFRPKRLLRSFGIPPPRINEGDWFRSPGWDNWP